jgi:hypothetical protein
VDPHKLKATAWDLRPSAAGSSIGFSGTNDAHRLMPLPFYQLPVLGETGLQATNGGLPVSWQHFRPPLTV